MNKLMTADQAIKLLLDGGVGVVPTDTVYGIAALASNPVAVERFYALKHREHKPGTIIAASVEQLVELGVKRRYLKAVEHLWPNPLSIVVPVDDNLAYLHVGLGSLAFRVTDDLELQTILRATGPLATSSANQPGETPAVSIEEAYDYFGDSVDFYVDGGDRSNRAPSTIIRVVDDAIEVLRLGAVQISETGRII